MIESIGYTGPAAALDAYARTGKTQAALYHFRTTCRLCSGPLRQVIDLGATALANEYLPAERAGEKQDEFPLIIAQCASCGHVQLQTVVNPERLYSEYTYTSGVAASFRLHLAELATELFAAGHRTIVDIGSNDGSLLESCRRLGMTGIGIDPARNLAAEASARGNLTIPAFFNIEIARAIRGALGKAPDVVTCLNAFAHSDDLAGIADGVRELIGETGTFVFEVAYLLDLLEKNEVGSCYHEHVSHHSIGPLKTFFQSRGMCVWNWQRIPSQGGSLRVWVDALPDHVGAYRQSLTTTIEAEAAQLAPLLAQWPSRAQAEREATLAELAPYIYTGNEGRKYHGGADGWSPGTLAVFGAPARLTTYAAMLGLKHDDVRCVFDDEPRKIGKLTPGLQWPIVSSEQLMPMWRETWQPAAILISAWPYASEIMARFPDYKGKWVLPRREAGQVAA